MLTTQEAQNLRIKEGLSSSILNMFYDPTAKFHRILVRIAKGEERAEVAYYYVNSDSETFSQEVSLSLATSNFLGKSYGYIIANVQNNNVSEPNGGNHGEESSEKSNKESSTKSKGKKSVSKEKDSHSEKSSLSKTDSTSEEMEDVESPFKAHPDDKPKEEAPKKEKAPKKVYTTYNRTQQRHVDVLTSYLNKLVGNESWKQNSNITQFSISLVGNEFIHDETGEISPEFQAKCKNFFFPSNGL